MKRTLRNALLALVISGSPALFADEADCYKLSVAVSKAVAEKPDQVLEIVQREVSTSPDCACEVVKAAIVASSADRKEVGQIVSTAIEAAPDKMRLVAQCAIAVAPDALPEVQSLLTQLDPQSGDDVGHSEKGGYAKGGIDKGGIVEPAALPSPLDGPYLVPGLPYIHPPVRTPPFVSDPGSSEVIDSVED
jgi:hypothetical protein